jgi:hypothetical protein
MDEVVFGREPVTDGSWSTWYLTIRVNGRPLEELARVVEQPFATDEGNPQLAGSYQPLTLWQIDGEKKHFLNQPQASWFDDGDTVLMGCTCGDWGCWPLTAQVAVDATHVVWSHFRTGHRDWDLSALGPFDFDREQYDEALMAITPR